MTDATYTAADMRAAWEAGRDAAADTASKSAIAYRASMHRAKEERERRDWDSAAMAAAYLERDIRALTPSTAALAEGQSHD